MNILKLIEEHLEKFGKEPQEFILECDKPFVMFLCQEIARNVPPFKLVPDENTKVVNADGSGFGFVKMVFINGNKVQVQINNDITGYNIKIKE